MKRALVVSIHDVSPHTQAATERILVELGELGVDRCSLLVIPNHHHRGPSLADPAFCHWLKERVAGGAEVVIHGYFHQRTRREGESWRDQMITRLYTADEGEFFDLSENAAHDLVSQARGEFQRAGFEPAGFIAPAWLLSRAAERALHALDLRYTTRLGSVTHLPSGLVVQSQSLVYSVRSSWRRACSLVWNPLLSRRLKSNSLLRIGIHPPDREHAAVWRQIKRLAEDALTNRAAITYADWAAGFPT